MADDVARRHVMARDDAAKARFLVACGFRSFWLLNAPTPPPDPRVEESRDSVVYYFRRQAELARSGTGSGTTTAGQRLAQADELAVISHEHILRERVVIGSADSLVKRLRELREQLHLDGIIVEPNPGGRIPEALMMRSLKMLAAEVAPALR